MNFLHPAPCLMQLLWDHKRLVQQQGCCCLLDQSSEFFRLKVFFFVFPCFSKSVDQCPPLLLSAEQLLSTHRTVLQSEMDVIPSRRGCLRRGALSSPLLKSLSCQCLSLQKLFAAVSKVHFLQLVLAAVFSHAWILDCAIRSYKRIVQELLLRRKMELASWNQVKFLQAICKIHFRQTNFQGI